MVCKYSDWTRGEDEALLNKLGGLEVVRGILRGTIEVVTKVICFIVRTLTVLVDETKTVDELAKVCKFDWVNNNITSANFPNPADGTTGNQELALFHFGKTMSSDAVISEMNKEGYEPATIWDLLGLAQKEPNLQRQFPIVALKSFWQGPHRYRYVPDLCGDADVRSLSLYYLYGDWDDDYRFLARRKCQK
jgi:hypothetical protein